LILLFKTKTKEPVIEYQNILKTPVFFKWLYFIDVIIYLTFRKLKPWCPFCDVENVGKLHQSNYSRKIRGICSGIKKKYLICFSLCCSKCRKRVKVRSVRFWGRSCYALYFVILALNLLFQNQDKFLELVSIFQLSISTVKRWQFKWDEFSLSLFWKEHQGNFNGQLTFFPSDLLQYYAGDKESKYKRWSLVLLLLFLSKLRGNNNSS
jgi:hypothetical protein